MTFLFLVTISFVWYVFLILSFLGGGGLVSEELDFPWCPVLYYTYCRTYIMFDWLIDLQKNWLIDWHRPTLRSRLFHCCKRESRDFDFLSHADTQDMIWESVA